MTDILMVAIAASIDFISLAMLSLAMLQGQSFQSPRRRGSMPDTPGMQAGVERRMLK